MRKIIITPRVAFKVAIFASLAFLAMASYSQLPGADSAPAPSLPLKVKDAWVRAVPPVSDATAAFMVLVNEGDKPLRLTGGSTPIAKSMEPMITTRKDVSGKEVLGMADVDALEIPPHGSCELKPGGNHLMIMGLLSHPKPGDKVTLTLRIDPGGQEVSVEAVVR